MDTLVSTPITLVCVAAYLPGRTILRVSSSSRRLRAAFSNEAKTVMSLCAESCRKCRQPTEDAVEILDQAMRAGTFFEVRGLAAV